MKIKLLAFGITRDLLGSREAELELDLPAEPTVADFRRALLRAYPDLGELNSLGIAVDNTYATDDMAFDPGAEIALIPPVSGG